MANVAIEFLRGDYADKMASTCNMVECYKQGNATVRIFDGAYANNPEPLTVNGQKVFSERINKICWDIVNAARDRGEDI